MTTTSTQSSSEAELAKLVLHGAALQKNSTFQVVRTLSFHYIPNIMQTSSINSCLDILRSEERN
jgi:hypothetical protein